MTGDVYRAPVYAALRSFMEERREKIEGRVAEVSGSTLVEEFGFPKEKVEVLSRPEFDLMIYPSQVPCEYWLVYADFVLEHVPDPFTAVRHLRDIIRPGGWLCLTTAFLFPIHEGSDFGDFWRFSPAALMVLLSGWDEVRAGSWGSRLAAERVLRWTENNHSEENAREVSAQPHDREFPVMTWVTARRP